LYEKQVATVSTSKSVECKNKTETTVMRRSAAFVDVSFDWTADEVDNKALNGAVEPVVTTPGNTNTWSDDEDIVLASPNARQKGT